MFKGRLVILPAGLIFLMVSCSNEITERTYFSVPERELEVVQSKVQSFMVDTVLTGLNRPWGMEFLPDNRVLITERQGNVLVVSNGILQERPLDGNIPAGLRDIQMHPQFEGNG